MNRIAIIKKRRKDIIILLGMICLVVVAFCIRNFYFRDQGEIYCDIYVDGKIVRTVDLEEDRKFSVEERTHVVFEVKDHAIAFIESDCPDKVCVHAGYLSHNGQSATCLPNKISIWIHSTNPEPNSPDIVAS